jgi:hypothetical protein
VKSVWFTFGIQPINRAQLSNPHMNTLVKLDPFVFLKVRSLYYVSDQPCVMLTMNFNANGNNKDLNTRARFLLLLSVFPSTRVDGSDRKFFQQE